MHETKALQSTVNVCNKIYKERSTGENNLREGVTGRTQSQASVIRLRCCKISGPTLHPVLLDLDVVGVVFHYSSSITFMRGK